MHAHVCGRSRAWLSVVARGGIKGCRWAGAGALGGHELLWQVQGPKHLEGIVSACACTCLHKCAAPAGAIDGPAAPANHVQCFLVHLGCIGACNSDVRCCQHVTGLACDAEHGVGVGEELRVVDTGAVDNEDLAGLLPCSGASEIERGFAGTGLAGLA